MQEHPGKLGNMGNLHPGKGLWIIEVIPAKAGIQLQGNVQAVPDF